MYRFWSWRSISSFRRDLTCERFFWLLFLHTPMSFSRQKHLLYRVRIIICITNIFATILFAFLTLLSLFLSISILLLSPLPSKKNYPNTCSLDSTTSFKFLLLHSCVAESLYDQKLHHMAWWWWLAVGMFFGASFEVGCSGNLWRVQFHSAKCRVARTEWGQFTIKVRASWSILSAEFAPSAIILVSCLCSSALVAWIRRTDPWWSKRIFSLFSGEYLLWKPISWFYNNNQASAIWITYWE